jgi:methionyl aminopeptidase
MIDDIRKAGNIHHEALIKGILAARAGRSLKEIDAIVEEYITAHDCIPLFKGYGSPPFPAASCLSVNDVAVHGIPDDYILQENDLLTIDVGLKYKNHCIDAARTVIIGRDWSHFHTDTVGTTHKDSKLIQFAYDVLNSQVNVVRNGCTFLNLLEAAEKVTIPSNMCIMPQWGGHRIGEVLHVPNSFLPSALDSNLSPMRQELERKKFSRQVLKTGDMICIEPVVTYDSPECVMDR